MSLNLSAAGWRDTAMFLAGLALLGWEVIVPVEPRALVLTIAAGLLGLPASLVTSRTAPEPQQPSASRKAGDS